MRLPAVVLEEFFLGSGYLADERRSVGCQLVFHHRNDAGTTFCEYCCSSQQTPKRGRNTVVAAHSELERFALSIYGADGVSAACLLLQARADLDVNLVLFAAFVGARGGALTPSQVSSAGSRIDEWNTEVVRPLRAVRQRLKSGPSPAPDERTAALRSAIQKLEIEAELIELAELGALGETLDTEPVPSGTAARAAAAAAAAAISVVLRAKTGRLPDVNESDAIAAIADAAAAFDDDTTQVGR